MASKKTSKKTASEGNDTGLKASAPLQLLVLPPMSGFTVADTQLELPETA